MYQGLHIFPRLSLDIDFKVSGARTFLFCLLLNSFALRLCPAHNKSSVVENMEEAYSNDPGKQDTHWLPTSQFVCPILILYNSYFFPNNYDTDTILLKIKNSFMNNNYLIEIIDSLRYLDNLAQG